MKPSTWRFSNLFFLALLAVLSLGGSLSKTEKACGACADGCESGCEACKSVADSIVDALGTPSITGPSEPVAVGAEVTYTLDFTNPDSGVVKTVTDATVDDGAIFKVLGFGQGTAIKLQALAEGETRLLGSCVAANGDEYTRQKTLKALKATKLELFPACWGATGVAFAGKVLSLPPSAELTAGLKLYQGTTVLVGQNYLPLDTGSLVQLSHSWDKVSRQEKLVLRAPATVGSNRMRSTIDPLFDIATEVYDTVEGVSLSAPKPGPYNLTQGSTSVFAHVVVRGEAACLEPSDRWTKVLTNETPEVCTVSYPGPGSAWTPATEVREIKPLQVSVSGKVEGICRLSVTIDGTSFKNSLELLFLKSTTRRDGGRDGLGPFDGAAASDRKTEGKAGDANAADAKAADGARDKQATH